MSNIGGKPLDTLVNGVWVRQADVVTEAQLATDAAGKTDAAKSIATWHGVSVVTVAGRQK